MKKTSVRIMVLGVCAAVLFALAGCSDNSGESTQTTEQAEAVSEVDAFAMSVNTVKSSYDNNEIYKGQLEEASHQAMIMEGFLDETPELYRDAVYKTKITDIYNTVESIDIGKDGLMVEDGAASYYNSLKQILTRMYNKFQ